jgi:hypothetical protein
LTKVVVKTKIRTLAVVLACACVLAFPARTLAQRGAPMIGGDPGRGAPGPGAPHPGTPGRGTSHPGTGRPGRPSAVRGPLLPLGYWWLAPAEPVVPEAVPDAAPSPPKPPAPPPAAAEASSIQPSPTVPPPFQSGTTGSLKLNVEPLAGDLYVDGFYAGRSEAIAGNPAGLRISVGWHRVQVRAAGYETLSSNVTIMPGQSNTLRVALRPIQR